MDQAKAWQMDEHNVTPQLVLLASVDVDLRSRLTTGFNKLGWTVREVCSGAAALAVADAERPEALLVDGWLPDLELEGLLEQMSIVYPGMDILRMDGSAVRDGGSGRSARRNELLHAIREADRDGIPLLISAARAPTTALGGKHSTQLPVSLPEMVGESPAMLRLAKMIRLVAPRSATVLIEGETGTGKELVAKAVHRLSGRAAKPFIILNCAAIPESLLEAELFGHTRGAFTGAVQARTGRIEAAHGGTLFLDEIGEMPLALQAKILRFLESGDLQRVGDNETMRVDVRVIAATHQPLEIRAAEKMFRLDLYHRLAVFPIRVPALRHRLDDMPLLVEFFLDRLGKEMPRKDVSAAGLQLLMLHTWPGNVRELMHVLERGAIMAEDCEQIDIQDLLQWKIF